MDHTLMLIERAHTGDKEARDTLVEQNLGLVYSVVKRFRNRGAEMEDLVQIGSIGLLKAIDKFDVGFDVKFSTYAVPMITGEIKRFLRDDGMIKVSRSLKETAFKAYTAREILERRLGREPSLNEIAEEIQQSVEELAMALDAGAEVESLHKIIYQGEGNDVSLMDKIEEPVCEGDRLVDRMLLEEILKKLEPEERQIIYLRYFCDYTQSYIAGMLGISQVQVSRMEKRILNRLRGEV
ncbi:SigF/SigG family RNA polymerase sporulation sigma factor [Novisyntrophococcus fermenticellae]|uniref:SigF/SigG family RNA polymerase sporulation sigma factor n=1 Tax=Novisyntrophococcus fermenticellae TaxID=2068655 RepID=UPI001E2AE0AB|nr:SigF/SigG family RNA polymerase sporulation sigma factor [Novisyntrophococcus fermenticellae]